MGPSIVKLLLSRDDIAADSQDDYYSTPLEEGIVRLLLSGDDVAVNSRDYEGRSGVATHVYAAFEPTLKSLSFAFTSL